jgi:HEAT repeat protein
MRRPLALAAVAFALLSGHAAAQPRVATPAPRPVERRNSLKGQFGVATAQRLLASDDFATRVRGIERLGAIGTNDAIDALVEAMEPGSTAARDPRARLVAVRALAPEAARENVQKFLKGELSEAGGAEGRGSHPLATVLRGTAALALARSGDKKAISWLVDVAHQSSSSAIAALHALRAYPPASLDAWLEGHKRLTPALATLLGELGDLRAIDRLHAVLSEPDQVGKIAAAVALAKLGDEAALPVAREWLKRSEPRLRHAAAEVFVTLDAPEAPAAITALLESEALREDGLKLALRAPDRSLVPTLAKLLPDVQAELRGKVVAAIGRAGGAAQLATLLDRPETMLPAAFALATAPGPEARAALAQALASDKGRAGDARRLLLRAGVVRALVLDDPLPGLESALKAQFAGKAPADHAAGAFGLTALGAMSVAGALRASCGEGAALTCDAAAVAAARGALALADGASSLGALAPWLKRAAARDPDVADDGLAVAFGAALLAHPDGGDLPTSTLAAWAEAGGPLAPLAARALPSRDDEALRSRIKRLLEGSDPVVRAHVALGLGRDPEPNSVSLLTTAYRFEDDASVRRAIIRGLSLRTEVQRESTLVLARDLDPDDSVRALARAALAGRTLDLGVRPSLGLEPRRSVAWIAIDGDHDAPRAARIVRADGLALPVVADPDGVLLVPGLVPGAASLQLERAPARPKKFELP